eukprot:Nitzschia sp. Nitz4//scaffold41_size133979//132542//133555//NITZ4_003375-RA/size133979-processed-gene-0.269-mRNA-1//-1//CDS//3329551554//9268//frame0
MCISISPRTHAAAMARRPAVDNALLLQSRTKIPEAPAEEPEQATSPESNSDAAAKKKGTKHITVQHNYHDHSHDNRTDYQEEHPARGGVTTPFPLKLHEMLDAVAAQGMEDIVSWQPHGRCFLVHKPKEFVALLPYYFKLSKLASFQRQLNLYGFQRLTRGRDRGGYYHELFLKKKVFLAHSIQRIKIKGTGVRARSNPDQEPDFWSMPWIGQEQQPLMAHPQMVVPSYHPTMSMPLYPNVAPSSQPMVLPPAPKSFEEDVVLAFGSKPFHFLDHVKPAPVQSQVVTRAPQSNWNGIEELMMGEATDFFDGFDFPQNAGANIEDDAVFGNLVEQMIS